MNELDATTSRPAFKPGGKGSTASDISLVVPTKNRPQFVARLFRYFSTANFDGTILLGDSSTGEAQDSIKSLVLRYRNRLNLLYLNLPGLNGPEALGELIAAVDTRHMAFSPDDDFQIVPGLMRCSAALDSLPDHVAVHGIANIVTLGGASGDSPFDARPYEQAVLTQSNARDRLLSYLRGTAHPLFSVFRTNDWRALFTDVARVPDQAIGGELLPSCLAAIRGKIGQLDCLSLVRTDHAGRTLTRHAPLVSRMCSVAWGTSVEILRARVVEELKRTAAISETEATDIFLDGFSGYLEIALQKGKPSNEFPLRVRGVGKLVPGARWIRGQFRRWGIGKGSSLGLEALTHGNSPYREDFEMAIRSLRKVAD